MEQVVSFLFKYRTALFSKSQFGFGAHPSVFIILALASGLALLVYFLYARRSLKLATPWRAALILLRGSLLALIFLCLMRPVIVVPAVVPQSSYVAVLMDDSASMKLADEEGGTRLDAVQSMMGAGSQFHQQLSEKFKVRAFKFSDMAGRVEGASDLLAEGPVTNIQGALDQALRDSAGLPVSGVVLFSDGANNVEAGSSPLATTLNNLRARGLPVFAVGLGQPRLEGDVELVRASGPRRVLRGSPITAELLIQASGHDGSVDVEIAEDNHPLRTQPVPLQGDSTTVARVSFTPLSAGLHRYAFTLKPSADEPVTDNNRQEISVLVEDAHPRILYIEGEPRWEYGKIRSSLAEEKNVVLVSVLRSADGKFYRQGVESGEELAGGFPKSEEELFKYDALILGSVEATFFTFDQLKAIEQFVSRRGGTLMMTGGAKSFNAGGYATTPLADLLPVYLRGAAGAAGESQTFKAYPSDRGRDHPSARLSDQAEANAKAWEQMPAITLPEIITEAKPGATVVLEARSTRDRESVVPLLLEQRYGRGRTLALMASDTWRWRMMLESKNQSFETFWRNNLRYLVEGVRKPVEAAPERSYYGTGEPVRVRVEVGDEKFLNVGDASVTARVTGPSGRARDIQMAPLVEGGFEGYAGTLVPDEEGVFKVEVSARRGKGGAQVGSGQASFLVGPINREAHGAAQNVELLKQIASETGGQYYTPGQAKNLIEDLTHSEGDGSVRMTYDLWDMPINFMLLVGLAAGEWFIRKRKGLA
ncbi:MAG TPA: glutamine amidotransferase [Blastocatellia bacterium]|nr:glutamine amidotransferase [Blastocatellia bacterium]